MNMTGEGQETSPIDDSRCVLCLKDLKDSANRVKLTQKGVDSLIKYSSLRKDSDVNESVNILKCSGTYIVVHKECRRLYTDRNRVGIPFLGRRKCNTSNGNDDIDVPTSKKIRLRSDSKQPFDWKKDCFFCAQTIQVDGRHPDRNEFSECCKVTFRDQVLQICQDRDDAWGLEVYCRIQNCNDFVAVGAIYHKSCYSSFKNGTTSETLQEHRTVQFSSVLSNWRDFKRRSSGRPTSQQKENAFDELCNFLENEAEDRMLTFNDLQLRMQNAMQNSSNDEQVFSTKWLMCKLEKHYGDHVFFARKNGQETVVCFRDMAGFLIQKLYREAQANADKSTRIIRTAGRIIKADINKMIYNAEQYPSNEEISDPKLGKTWLPQSLSSLLDTLISSELKKVSIGQCIVSATKPTSTIPPIPFGLGVEMDHVFGSKWLINELHRLGFSISYEEVCRYKQSVIQFQDTDGGLDDYFPGGFTQWVADNVDHNITTLNGEGTFHGMGVIAVTASTNDEVSVSRHIPRLQRISAKEIVQNRGIPIVPYEKPDETSRLSSSALVPLVQLKFPFTLPPSLNLDMVWHSGWFFRNMQELRPSWSGYMQKVSVGDHPPKAKVMFLPIIDLESSNETCIYSTLLFVEKQALKLNQETPCITFDQPLWIKAVEIINTKKMNIVSRLGGFHMMMSFLGSIGSLMAGSGLAEAFQTSYGPNTVSHMLTGKAVSRALRGHFMAASALHMKLIRMIMPSGEIQAEKTGATTTMPSTTDARSAMPSEIMELPKETTEDQKCDEYDDTLIGYDHMKLNQDCIAEDDMKASSVDDNNIFPDLVDDQDNQDQNQDNQDLSRNDTLHGYGGENGTVVTQNATSDQNICGLQDQRTSGQGIDHKDVDELHHLYEGLLHGRLTVDEVSNSEALHNLMISLRKLQDRLTCKSRTARLWIQYMDYIDILKVFIRAERTGDWHLHLVSVSRMINLFAATGHNNYAKCSRLYLQMMLQLPETHPWLFRQFMNNGYHTVRRSDRFWAGLWTDLIIEQVLMRSIKSRGGLTRGRGMTESVRTTWVQTMHKCAELHHAMTTATNLRHITSDQHVELGTSRLNRDNEDLVKMIDWFDTYDPFDESREGLQSLASGGIASGVDGQGINCDEAEEVGAKIQMKMDNMRISDVSLKRSDQVKTLIQLQKGVKLDNQVVHIDATVLFARLTVLVERTDDMSPYFKYELTLYPTSLFKDACMRKPDKSALGRAILQTPCATTSPANPSSVISLSTAPPADPPSIHVSSIAASPVRTCQMTFVLDGGALLHRVRWQKNQTYLQIVDQYLRYIKTKYGTGTVIVFDGYTNGPSTKDHEHLRRSGKTAAVIIKFEESMVAHPNQQTFLANDENKSRFITLLSRHLTANGHDVHQALDDADTKIVSTALHIASTNRQVTVVADDTDILVLLLHHYTPELSNVYLRSEMRCKGGSGKRICNIREEQERLGSVLVDHLIFIHAWGGCDTVSALYGKGKVAILHKIKASEEARKVSEVFSSETSSQDEVASAGIRLLVIIYGGKPNDTLNGLRHLKYMNMVARSTSKPKPEVLPPTERAAYFHCLRIHLQVIQWKTMSSSIRPTEWGWKMDGHVLTPIQTDLEPGPEEILNVIRCRCKASSKKQCGTTSCSCRKHGLQCVSACGECRGVDCWNQMGIMDDDVERDR